MDTKNNETVFSCLIIEDDPLMTMTINDLLDDEPFIEVQGEYEDGVEGIKAILSHKPDFIILDINMPGINGLEVLELSDYQPFVIVISGDDSLKSKCEDIPQVIAFLGKPIDRVEFKSTIALAKKFSEMERNID